MAEFQSSIIYFDQSGKENTERVLELAGKKAGEFDIHKALIASTTGYTGSMAIQALAGMDIVVVSHAAGFKGKNQQELTPENRQMIEKGGGMILTATHAFGGVNRAIRKQLSTCQPDEIIAEVLRTFGQGMKVIFEMALMASDAGIVQTGQPTLAIAGTHRGADTAAVVLPVNSFSFFDFRILDLICMPSDSHPGFNKSQEESRENK